MNLLERIQSKIDRERQRRYAAPKDQTKTRQNIAHNRFDREMWLEMRKLQQIDHDVNDLMIGDTHRGGEREGYDNGPELLQDLAYAIYKPDPHLEPKRRVEKDARLNRAILEEVQSSPYYHELREYTVLDDTTTAIALGTMADAVRDILARNQEQAQQSNQDKAESTDEMNDENNRPPGVSPPPPPDQKGDEGGEEGDEGDQSGQSSQQSGQQTDGEGEESEGEGQPGQEPGDTDTDDSNDSDNDDESEGENEGEGEGEGGDTDQEFDDDPDYDDEEHEGDGDGEGLDDLVRAINHALRDAAEDVEELDDLRAGIGLDTGTWRQMSPDERLKMAERLRTPAMRELADMIGRMKRFAMGQQAQKISDVEHEPVDVETGNSLRHLLGSEYALLDDEDLEWEFYRRFIDGEMLQYKLQGTDKAGKGPIVACIDKSYSMSGRPFTWALGVAEGLRRICQEQERDYYALFFGNNDDRHRFDFPSGGADFNKVLEFLSAQADGGTQFDGVLEEALARVSAQYDKGLEKADIVFITDGRANLSDEWLQQFNEEKDRIGCRVFGVYIGGARDMYGAGRAPAQVLEQFSNLVIPVAELTTSAVGDIFSQV